MVKISSSEVFVSFKVLRQLISSLLSILEINASNHSKRIKIGKNTCFFYKQQFYKQRLAEIGKNQANARQYPKIEL